VEERERERAREWEWGRERKTRGMGVQENRMRAAGKWFAVRHFPYLQ